MKVSEIMTAEIAACSPSDSVKDAAKLMILNDCGQIPVVGDKGTLIGVITDRDIACRCVAEGLSSQTCVADIMSRDVVTVSPDDDIESCCAIMEENQVRRLPVLDVEGRCCGIVSQADIANAAERTLTGDLVRQVSEPA